MTEVPFNSFSLVGGGKELLISIGRNIGKMLWISERAVSVHPKIAKQLIRLSKQPPYQRKELVDLAKGAAFLMNYS